jgi:hypothetical protein
MNLLYKRLLGIVALVCALIILIKLLLPGLAQNKIEHNFAKLCNGCRIKISSLDIVIFQMAFQVSGVDFKVGQQRHTEVAAKIESVLIPFNLIPLFFKRFSIATIKINNLAVTVIEGDEKNISSAEPLVSYMWGLNIQMIQIANANFKYIRRFSRGDAAISVQKITASVGPIDTSNKTENTPTIGKATGQLESSGNFELNVSLPVFAPSQRIFVDLKIAGQRLTDFNAFFNLSDGILLKGILNNGHASVAIADGTQEAWVTAKYDHFDVFYEKYKYRTALTAFFSNLVKLVKLDKSVMDEDIRGQTRGVSLKRRDESIFHFILRGMRDAALKVAMR